MDDNAKTKEQLIRELQEMRQKISEMETLGDEQTTSMIAMSNSNQQLKEQFPESQLLESQLVEQREWFRVTLSSIGDAVIACDTKCRVTFVNPVAEQLTGYSLPDALGRPIHEVFNIFNEYTGEPAEIPVYRVIREGFVIGLANHTGLISRGGDKYSIADSAAPILNNAGEIIGVVMVFRDITASKRLEEEMAQLDKLKVVGQMAAGIAHEIRNPMTTVRGFLQLLGVNKDCKPYKEYFDLMTGELDRANAIISGFLSLAKGRMQHFKIHNLNTIVETMAPLIQSDAANADKYVQLTLEEIADVTLDEQDIRQLFLNLTRNGLEAMPPGGMLVIKTYVDDDKVVLAIQDNGPGIPPEVLKKIGTPFFTTKEKGTGLGLAVCYSIAANHDAMIKVETSPEGTIFFVRFSLPSVNT